MTIKFDLPFFKFRAAICRFVVVDIFTVSTNFKSLANFLPNLTTI